MLISDNSRQFFELHGDARFTDWGRATDDHAPKMVNRAGFGRTDGEPGETEYYVLPEVFRTEVCKGFDYKAVCRLLVDRGALRMEGRSYTRKERLPGMGNTSCYRITPKLWGTIMSNFEWLDALGLDRKNLPQLLQAVPAQQNDRGVGDDTSPAFEEVDRESNSAAEKEIQVSGRMAF